MKRSFFLGFVIAIALIGVIWLGGSTIQSWLENIGLANAFARKSFHIIMALAVIFFLHQFFGWLYMLTKKLDKKDNFILGIQHISVVIYGALLVLLMLSFFNIGIQEAFTTVSIVAAALAITLKDYVSNMINGMIMTFQSQISIDDVVKIGEQRGKVVNISLMYIHLLNDDDDLLYIPNNLVFQQELINYTKREIKKSSIDFEIENARIKSIEALEEYLISEMKQYQHEVDENSYNLRVFKMAKDHLHLKFQYILKNAPNKELEKEIRKFVIRSIVRYS